MGDDYSNGTTGDTLELFKAEREDLEKTVACVRQMARDFDTLTEQRRLFDPNRIAFLLQLKGPHLRRCVWKGIFTPEAFQWHKEALARKKALGEQVLQDTTAFAHALIRWAEDLEKRERQYQAALSTSPSVPIVTGGNGLMPDEFGAAAPPGPTETSAPSGDASRNPTSNSPLAQVLQALEAGGQSPTTAQLENIGKACDEWQRFAVSHGVSPFVAGQQIQNIVHNYYSSGSGPNPGSEGVLGFQQGLPAGAGAAGIISGAIVGISSSQRTGSVWSLGPGPRGMAIESQLGGNLPPGFPTIDRFENGVITSIKSIDLSAPSYQSMGKLINTLDTYTDDVADFNGNRWGGRFIASSEIKARQLQIAIPPRSMSPAQEAIFNAAVTQAQSKGVTLIVTEIH